MTKSNKDVLHELQQQSSANRIVIVGGGIVGSAIAYYLSREKSSAKIVLIDASLSNPQGSTAFAPGFIGQLNSIKNLTKVAKESVQAYAKIPGAFQRVGGLEIASTEAGIAELHHRRNLARAAGLTAEIISSKKASEMAPHFHAEDSLSRALLFESDGTANPPTIVQYYQAEAKAKGVVILGAAVIPGTTDFTSTKNFGSRMTLTTDLGRLEAETVVAATGIWTQQLLKSSDVSLPIIPVAHPYAYGPTRPVRDIKQPFVRWPEKHIYARDHGEVDGFGTYDHVPSVAAPDQSALQNRVAERHVLYYAFGELADESSAAHDSALSIFQHPAQRESKTPYEGFNAIFSVTPDSMPFVGAVPGLPGLYVAAAVWITHAAGVGRMIADLVSGKKLSEVDIETLKAFDVSRFDGEDTEVLERRALATYNDIYNKQDHR